MKNLKEYLITEKKINIESRDLWDSVETNFIVNGDKFIKSENNSPEELYFDLDSSSFAYCIVGRQEVDYSEDSQGDLDKLERKMNRTLEKKVYGSDDDLELIYFEINKNYRSNKLSLDFYIVGTGYNQASDDQGLFNKLVRENPRFWKSMKLYGDLGIKIIRYPKE